MRAAKYRNLINQPAKPRANIVKPQWDGARGSFDQYAKKLEGLLQQQGAGYLLNEEFQETYAMRGLDWCATPDFYNQHRISYNQAKFDINYLYGVLRCTYIGTGNNVHLEQHKPRQDGVLAWMGYIQDYANEGSDTNKLGELERKLETPFKKNYPSGLTAFIDAYQATIAEFKGLCKKIYQRTGKRPQNHGG